MALYKTSFVHSLA